MSLLAEVATLSRPLTLRGRSDYDLEQRVTLAARRGGYQGGLTAVPHLDAGFQHTPLDVLLNLARAMRPVLGNSTYDVQQFWGLLRYLGAFEDDGAGAMRLTTSAAEVTHNQRRVLSEELGIGMAIGVAEIWLHRGRPSLPIAVVDVDLALTRGKLSEARIRKTVKAAGPRRPDYILVRQGIPGRYAISLLECKGTTNASHAFRQLARASDQLRGLVIGTGRPRPALACAALLNSSTLRYNALQLQAPGPGREPIEDETDYVEIEDNEIRSVQETFIEGDGEYVSERTLAAESLRASWSNLGDLAGDPIAADMWATSAMRSKRATSGTGLTSTRSVAGIPITGVVNQVVVPGGMASVIIGVHTELAEVLRSGAPSQILASQRRLATQAAESRIDAEAAVTLAHDGAALGVQLL